MKKISFLLLAVMLAACGNNSSSKSIGKESEKPVTPETAIPELRMPAIPMTIVEPMERASFLAAHYWDHLEHTPITTNNDTIKLEQYFSNYLAVLNESNKSKLQVNLQKSFSEIQKDSVYLSMFNHLADKYLYDPNSPFRNDEVYLMFVEMFKDNPALSFADKERLKFKYSLLQKNRIGYKAENFRYKTDKQEDNLYAQKADLLLLYFNNPGCHACAEVQQQLIASNILMHNEETGKLKILSLYPDEDLSEWSKHKNDQPDNWIKGYDSKQEIKTKLLYDLKAIPTLYLLDKNKNVLLKDATVQQVEAYLYEHQ